MTQFASVDDFNALHDADFEVTDARIVRLLEMASGMIQTEARQKIEFVADDVVKLLVDDRHELILPERPVLDVTAVTLTPYGGLPIVVDVGLLTWQSSGELTGLTTFYWPLRSEAEVTYDHGLADIPDTIMTVCCSIVGRMLQNAGPTYRPGSPAPAESDSGAVLFPADERAQIRSAFRKTIYSAKVGTGYQEERAWHY
jgi:hypothetical protein